MLEIEGRREGFDAGALAEIVQNPLEEFRMRSVFGGGSVKIQQFRLDVVGGEESHDLGCADPLARVDQLAYKSFVSC